VSDEAWATLLADEFRDMRVLVTGSSRGIGAAVAGAFAALGAHVALHGSSAERVDALAGELAASGTGSAFGLAGDFTQPGEATRVVEEAVQRLGGLDVLINNAGTMMGRVLLADLTEEHVRKVIALNAESVVTASRAAVGALRATRGTIISTTSISARTGGSAGSSMYSAAKAFVSTFTRSLAAELGPDGVRVNAVSPGTIDTDFHQRYSSPEKLAGTAERIPLRRLGTAEDCVGAYLFLASERLAGYVTGQVLEVNGGQLLA
jgi:3-oxoacyl-[acyl-carrier protein] reductase